MRTIFADTYYFLALLSKTDQGHVRAVQFTAEYTGRMVTTGWVLTELGDALAASPVGRARFLQTLEKLAANPNMAVHPCTDSLFREGVTLYSQRPDKEWSLTDCISFVVMQKEGIIEALTGDQHFEQAGFTALLK
jgi:predicted nucleic acid-binding protein